MSIGQVESCQVAIPGEQGARRCQIFVCYYLDLIGRLYLFDSFQLCLSPVAVQDQMIQLSQYQRRDQKRSGDGLDCIKKEIVVVLVAIEDRQKAPGIDNKRQRSKSTSEIM